MDMHLQGPRQAGETTPRATLLLSHAFQIWIRDACCLLGIQVFFPPGPLTICEKPVLKGEVGGGTVDSVPSSVTRLSCKQTPAST